MRKCEFVNPGGWVKDRIVRFMILDAELSERIKKGDLVIEPISVIISSLSRIRINFNYWSCDELCFERLSVFSCITRKNESLKNSSS